MTEESDVDFDLFDKNVKRRMLKDEEAALNKYRTAIEQRFGRYMEFGRNFRDQMKVRYTPVTHTTSRRSILYNEKGPFGHAISGGC